jgi:hypothetical protein
VSATVNGGFSGTVKNAKGFGVSFGVDASASVVTNTRSAGGVTTFTVDAKASITVKGGINTPKAGVEIARSEGLSATYSVAVPDGEGTRRRDPKTINPFDPLSMPTGTVITFDGAHNSTNAFKATFKNLSVQTKVTRSEGVSVAVEKTGANTVRVTAGPTEALDAFSSFGISVGVASASIGRQDKIKSATLKTAEFDLSTKEGKAAYNDFLTSGDLPTKNSRGIAKVATIEKLDASSQGVLGANVLGVDLSFRGNKNSASKVIVTNADGTKTVTAQAKNGPGPTLGLSQSFDANGDEILSKRAFTFTFKVEEGGVGSLVESARTGAGNPSIPNRLKDGSTATLTFTEAQMRAMLEQNRTAQKAYPNFENDFLTNAGDPKLTTVGYALNILDHSPNGYGLAKMLFDLSESADGDMANRKSVPIDFSVTVE